MRVIIGNVYYPTVEGSTMQITHSATDPVPTCAVNIRDTAASLNPLPMQELLVIDDQKITNPTINLLQNPSLNPYTSSWTQDISVSGITLSTVGGGGIQYTFSNAANNSTRSESQTLPAGSMVGGASYTLSFTVIGVSPVNLQIIVHVTTYDVANNAGHIFTSTFSSVPTTLTRETITIVAPANTSFASVSFSPLTTSGTNSGTVTFTQVQFEQNLLPTVSYPTPWCGPSQTNCRQLPLGLWIRQYRTFAGFVTNVRAQDYHGDVRTLAVTAVGYAWIMGSILGNDTFTSRTDAQIITTLLGKYLLSNGTAMLTTTNVISAVTVSNLGLNWDDLRTVFDGLSSLSGSNWTVDQYWNYIYAPPGYYSMTIVLLCDDSGTPDLVTTFPAYHFSAESDFTQPGSTILVLGSGTNVAKVVDPGQMAQLGITSGYTLPTGTSWMRKVNDSQLQSVADCTTRGSAELLQYDIARSSYHLTTNVELLCGYGVRITSDTDGLNNTVLLIQQVQATWIGTDETGTDVWEYVADLGATNRAATNMISRIFRRTNTNTSAPAISTTTLETLETVSILDVPTTSVTLATGYQPTILADGPIAYYRLNSLEGTVVDDFSGNAYAGTLTGSVTLNTATLLTDTSDTSDTAMTFNGTTGYVALPTSGTWPTGNGAWSLECWCKPSSSTPGANSHLVTIGNPGTNSDAGAIVQTSGGGWGINTWGGAGHDFGGNGTSTAGTVYYIAGTYDGASHLNLYVGVGGTITHYGPFNPGTLNLSTSHQDIGATYNGSIFNSFFAGVIDEPAVYNVALSSGQVSAHYAAGRP
ncbi:MAG: LamG domain-containing protein [Ktedonobacteraceae bacterium]|nr:LamG domain-containing protein [Ktedonobacteraceae bacterium]